MSESCDTSLHTAIINNQFDHLQNLLKMPKTDHDVLNHCGETPLFLSLKKKCGDELISMLIDHGCNVNIPNRKGITPLHLAVQRRTNVILIKLIQKGADITAKDYHHGYTPLHSAIMQGRLHNLRHILQLYGNERGISVSDTNRNALLFFSLRKNCNDKIVSFLINNENVNAADSYGITPLHLALLNRQTNFIARELINNGANINAVTNKCDTPLHASVISGNIENISMLLYYNASVNEKNLSGKTPFDLAILRKEYFVSRCLLDYIADFNSLDNEGFSSFHYALRDDPDIAIQIMERGGNANLPWHETHSLILCLWWHTSSEVFEAIWNRINLKALFDLVEMTALLESYVLYCKFPDDQFIRCFYMMLKSPHVAEFFDYSASHEEKESLISMVIKHNMPPEHREKVILILLSYGEEVSFNDVCFLYEKYGFENTIEFVLVSGCYIHCNVTDTIYINPMVSKMLYNNFNIYKSLNIYSIFTSAHDIYLYSSFYRIDFEWSDTLPLSRREFLFLSKARMKSLVQICRDVIRKIVYKTQRSAHSFKVYQAFLQLPVPSIIRDILFLKRAIY